MDTAAALFTHHLPLRNSAALIFAVAVKQLFPKATLFGSSPTSSGFIYDVELSFPLTDQVLQQIDLRMREIISAGKVIYEMEMFRPAILEFFRSFSHANAFERVEGMQGSETFFCSRIDNMGDFIAPCLDNTSLVRFFKLVASEQVLLNDAPVQRISAAVFDKNDDLKQFLKSARTKKRRVSSLGLVKECDGQRLAFLPAGVAVKERLERVIDSLQTDFSSVISPLMPDNEPLSHALELFGSDFPAFKVVPFIFDSWEARPVEGLLSSPSIHTSFAIARVKQEEILEKSISSLQLIVQFLKMAALPYRVIFSSDLDKRVHAALSSVGIEAFPEKVGEISGKLLGDAGKSKWKELPWGAKSLVQFRALDGYGREWPVAYILLTDSKESPELRPGSSALIHSLCYSVERLIGLLQERAGRLPFLLADEQVRILVLHDGAKSFAAKCLGALQEKGIRCRVRALTDPLQKEMFDAFSAGVHNVVCLGMREAESGLLKVRSADCESDEEISLAAFLAQVEKKNSYR